MVRVQLATVRSGVYTVPMESAQIKNFLTSITLDAGEILRGYFGKVGVKYNKGNSLNVVTEADLAANTFLIKKIQKKYPDHGILSEETGYHQKNAEWLWTIDPLDGTLNFSRRIPLFAVMISVSKKSSSVSKNRDLRYAAIYDVMQNELFYAEKGKGAFRNGKRIHGSKKMSWTETFGLMGGRPKKENRHLWKTLIACAEKQKFGFLSPGSAGIAAAYAADGRCDWWIGKGGYVWDYAPSVLLLKEAGYRVTNHDGKPWVWDDPGLIVAKTSLSSKILQALHRKKP